MSHTLKIEPLTAARQPSVTQAVYGALYDSIVRLELPPGTKLSEADVARKLDVSRQPVRDAFYRLNQQGFLLVRPQRATVVTKISAKAVLRACFIRTALELEAVMTAMQRMTEKDIAALEQIVTQQTIACASRSLDAFQRLDDDFHAKICSLSGHAEVWDVIKETKAHMDRVRYLTLDKGKEMALEDHKAILNAMKSNKPRRARKLMRNHLSRIEPFMAKLRPEHIEYFEEDDREY